MAPPTPSLATLRAMASTYPSVFDLAHTRLPSDGEYTPTLDDQRDTEDVLSDSLDLAPPVVPGRPASKATSATNLADGAAAAVPTTLRKGEHVQFLASQFARLPAGFVALDASRPWLVYWTLHSIDLLGVMLDPETKRRAVSTLLAYLSPSGGFAGGAANSHLPHLLPTYAAVCALAIAGSPGPGGGWDELVAARQDIYDFFMRCKHPHGGFVVCDGGEIDVRGTYCLLVVATLLDLLTPELLHNVDAFIAACQTYEGGFACSSYSFGAPDGPDNVRAAMAEAHGGYTSCSLNSHFLLASVVPADAPLPSLGAEFPRPIDVPSALRWSAFMQGEASEVGGFRGRSNKLVDGCYGWWVGGGFPVLEELSRRESEKSSKGKDETEARIAAVETASDDEWVDEASMQALFNRVALQEYILLAAQREPGEKGGLRDKPPKRPDLYHTCNNLSGLSVAQHHMVHSAEGVSASRAAFDTSRSLPAIKPTTAAGGWASEDERQRARREAYANVLGWAEADNGELVLGGMESRVNTTAPVVNILGLRLKPLVEYFYAQGEQAKAPA